MLYRYFQAHPKTVGETYWQHLRTAWGFAAELGLACLCCFAHGLLPCLFEKTGSEKITRLHDRMVVNRHRAAASQQPAAPTNVTPAQDAA